MGQTPAVGPTANRGFEIAGQQRLGVVVKALEQLVPMLGSTSEIGQAVLKAMTLLGKHVQPGSVDPAAEKNQIESMALKNAEQGRMMAMLRQQQGAGAGGPPGGAPGGAPPAPPGPPGMAA